MLRAASGRLAEVWASAADGPVERAAATRNPAAIENVLIASSPV
jgi:hypothetical protein